MPSANAPAPAAEAAPAAAGDAAESAPPVDVGLPVLAGAAAAPDGSTVERDAAAAVAQEVERAHDGGALGVTLPEGWGTMPLKERILSFHPEVEVTRARSSRNVSTADAHSRRALAGLHAQHARPSDK